MKLIKQTVIIANEDTKKKGYNVPEGFTGKFGYFLSEEKLKELLETIFDASREGHHLANETILGLEVSSDYEYNKEEYINNLLNQQ